MPGGRYGCVGAERSQPGWLGGTEEDRQRGSTSEGKGTQDMGRAATILYVVMS